MFIQSPDHIMDVYIRICTHISDTILSSVSGSGWLHAPQIFHHPLLLQCLCSERLHPVCERFAVLCSLCSSFSFSWGGRVELGCCSLSLKRTVPEMTAGVSILREALASVWEDSLVFLGITHSTSLSSLPPK